MKVLITGILGFIGSHLAQKLVKDGHEVYGLVRRVACRNIDPLGETGKEITLVSGDITDYASTRNALRIANPNIVFHLAALSPVRDSFERPFEYQQANFVGTMNVAHSLLELPDPEKRKMLAASTAEVYGLQGDQPLTEDLALKPSSPYSVTKAAGDMYLQMMFTSFNLHGTVLRPTNSFGRKFEKNFLVEYVISQMLKGESLYIGAPDSIRDYMYVDDHVNAYVLAAKDPKADRQVYNAGTGIGVTNRHLVETLAEKIGYNIKKVKFGSYPPGYPLRPLSSDQPYLVLNATKIKKDLKWKPTINLSEGLDTTIAYFKKSKL